MIRTALIWLLLLALPAQGALAATMVFCGPNHHDRASAATAAHHAGAAHSHHETADGHADHAAADGTAAAEKFAHSDMKMCSVCASCCSAAAIHDTAPQLPVLEAVAAHFAALAPAVEPFAADGPDRPPRRLPV